MTEDDRVELMRTLLAAESAAISASQAEIISPHGGEVIALDLAPGQAVSAGTSVGLVRADSEGNPEVVAFVPPNDAERLRPGMEAHVSIRGAEDGNVHVVSGHVASVSASVLPPPQWLLDQDSVIPQQPHELRVALDDIAPDFPLADGAGVSLRIVLGRESFASLLRPESGS